MQISVKKLIQFRAGDIAAVVGVKDAITGDTLCAEGASDYCLNRLIFQLRLFLLQLSQKIKLIMKRWCLH